MSAKSTPRPWTRLDLAFLEQDTVCTVGEQFGAGGIVVLLACILEAKRAAMAGAPTDEQGMVSLRYSALARTTFVAEAEVRAIVAALVNLGLLVMMSGSTSGRFTARLAKWSAWEPRDSTGATRQQRYRARRADRQAGPPCVVDESDQESGA